MSKENNIDCEGALTCITKTILRIKKSKYMFNEKIINIKICKPTIALKTLTQNHPISNHLWLVEQKLIVRKSINGRRNEVCIPIFKYKLYLVYLQDIDKKVPTCKKCNQTKNNDRYGKFLFFPNP